MKTQLKRLAPWRLAAFVASILAFTLVGSGALAYWSAGSATGGNGAAAAVSVNQGATPTVVSAGTSVTVSWAASTLSNGSAVTGYLVKRYNATTNVVQTIGSACSGTITALTCTETAVPSGQWKYTVTPVFATNWTGAESSASAVVYTSPTAPSNSLSLSNITGGAALVGATVYYNGTNAGSFTIINAVADSGSGPASSSTAALGGTSTGWTTTASTVSSPTGGPYVSNAFSWTAGATSSPTEVVTGRDLANNQVTTTLTFVNDSTAPTGTIAYTNGYQVGRYVTVTLTATDAGSGIGTAELQRASANFVSGTCGTFSAFANLAASPVSPYTDSAVSNSKCYEYRYVLTDLVGNTFTATSANVAWVDYAGAVRYETPGILSQLRFGDSAANGNVKAADSVGSNNATYVNGPVLGANGDPLNDPDTAVTLDGANDYIQATTTTGLPTGAASRSAELWFKTSATGHQSLFTYGSFGNNEEFGLWIEPGGTQLTGWGWGGGDDPTFTNASSVEDGKWHQVVETYNGTAITLYVDGVSLGSQTMTRNTIVDSYGLQIGDVVEPGDGNSGGYFNGSLDEFSIYTTALTQTQVTNHYQLGENTGTDISGPTGGSVAVSGLGGTGSLYSTSTSLSLALAKGTDTTGVAATGAYLYRATATLTSTANANGVCGTFSGYTLVATDPTTPYTDTVADQACYVYKYAVPDTLGNYTTYVSGLVKVDTTAPSTPTLAVTALTNAYYAGGILYYRSGATGSFTMTVTSSDTTSGIATYAFPALGTGWTSPGTGTSNAGTYSFTAAAATSGTQTLTVTNNATGTASTTFTLTIDALAPTASVPTYAATKTAAGTTPVTIGAITDSGSGVATSQLLYESARLTGGITTGTCGTYTVQTGTGVAVTASSTYTATVVANTCYRYELVVTDRVGNQTPTAWGAVLKVG